MRIHRLTLRDYRGVGSCQLTFADRGITVVEGDNESGKSSAAEALHLLLGYRDDSAHRRVAAVKPLHLDAGAGVEAELSVGSLRFTYAKRWHRDRMTKLRVTSPRAEVVTGRDAHDRVLELLSGTVDLDLWRTLSAPQADAVDQVPLRDHASLVTALDRAAGGALGTPEESDLLARAEREAARWWTPSGRPKGTLVDLRDRAGAAAAAVHDAEGAIAALEADVAWCADLERRAGDLASRSEAAVDAATAAAGEADRLDAAQAALAGLAMRAELAASRAELARRATTSRGHLAAGSDAAAEAVGHAEAELAGAASATVEAEAREVAAAAAAQLAVTVAAVAGEDAEAAGAHHTALRAAATTAQVASQLGEVEAVLAEADRLGGALAEASAVLALQRSTPAALSAIQTAHDEVVRTEAALAAGRATVQVEALADLRLLAGGSDAAMAEGTTAVRSVAGQLIVEVPGQVRLTVTGGRVAGELEDHHRRATAVLAERCAAIGVADLTRARAAEDDRRALAGEVKASEAAVTSHLGGRTVVELVALAATAREVLGAGDAARADPGPAAIEEARRGWDAACAAHRGAQRDADVATTRAAATSAAVGAARVHGRRAESRLATVRDTAARFADDLTRARVAATDVALASTATSCETAADEALTAWSAAAAALDVGEVAFASQAAQRTAAERDGIAQASAQLREELVAVRSRLEVQGEGGFHDRLADARRAAAALHAEQCSVEARAAAAQRLFTTLVRHRDEAARAYGAPLQAELERLGRVVFGPTFVVELDDQLRITTRVLDGTPVPWSELSVGAREQLAVLSRLATAMIVSPDGGVPVVFDDVLGFTDPSRLALMSAAFEVAAETCQIIVLTCDPARYRHLARAATHCLTAPRGLEGRQVG